MVHLTGDTARQRTQQVQARPPDLLQQQRAPQGRRRPGIVVDRAGVGDGTAGQGPHRTGGQRIDANAVRAEVGGEIPHAGFERGFGHTHHVVVRHDPFGTEIGQGQQAAAVRHDGGGSAGQIGERVAADPHGPEEVVERGIDVPALQLLLVGKGDGVDDEIDAAPGARQTVERGIKARLVLNIAGHHQARAQRFGERLDAPTQRLGLIGEGQLGPMFTKRPGDPPGDRVAVGHAHDQPALAGHKSARRSHRLPTCLNID